MSSAVISVTEREFDRQVRDFAKMTGWMTYHTWLPIHSPAGFPDLCLVRRDRIVFAELKSAKGKTTPKQDEWLEALRATGKVEVYLWRPDDLQAICELLR